MVKGLLAAHKAGWWQGRDKDPGRGGSASWDSFKGDSEFLPFKLKHLKPEVSWFFSFHLYGDRVLKDLHL